MSYLVSGADDLSSERTSVDAVRGRMIDQEV